MEQPQNTNNEQNTDQNYNPNQPPPMPPPPPQPSQGYPQQPPPPQGYPPPPPPPQGYSQQPMQPPPQYYTSPINQEERTPTVGNYIVVFLLLMIPLAGIILLIVWAAGGSGTPMWKTNFARARLIMVLISIGISIIVAVIFWGVIFGTIGSLACDVPGSYYYW